MHVIFLGLVGRAGRGEEGKEKRWPPRGPWQWAEVCCKEKEVSGNRNNTSKGMEKRNHVVSLGTGCVSKRGDRISEMRPDQMVRALQPDAKELGSITEGTKVFRKEWFYKRWQYETHFVTFFSGRKIFPESFHWLQKCLHKKINSRTSWNNSKGPAHWLWVQIRALQG